MRANQSPEAWETLEKVHEGTVADLAFSTKDFISPEEMFELLKDYDIRINWMVLYMEELETFTEGWSGGSNSVSVAPWGLTHGSVYDKEYFRNTIYFLAPEWDRGTWDGTMGQGDKGTGTLSHATLLRVLLL